MIYYVPPNPTVNKSKIKLNLSPLTTYMLDVATDAALGGKNVILEFPSTFSNISLLIGNKYSSNTDKSTLLFVKNDRISELNDEYYHLQTKDLALYIIVPIGIKTDAGLKLKEKFIKKISKSLKTKYTTRMNHDLTGSEKPLLILIPSDQFIKNVDGPSIEIPKKMGKGLAIFENINTRTIDKTIQMMNWCEREKINYIMMITFATPKFYDILKNKENMIIVPFHNGLLENSKILKDTYLKYDLLKKQARSDDCYDCFNIDRAYNYYGKIKVKIHTIENGYHLHTFLNEISQCISKLSGVDIILKRELLTLSKTAYEAIESFTPIDSIRKYSYYSNCRINGIGYCNNIQDLSHYCNDNDKAFCGIIINSFWAIRNTIEKCRSPLFDNGYKNDNKFNILFQLVNKYKETKKLIYIVTPNTNEIAYLNTVFKKYFADAMDRIKIANPDSIDEHSISGGILIISGRLEYNQLSIIDLPFEEKIVLAYSGVNEKIIEDLMNLYSNVCNYRKELFLQSTQTIREELNFFPKHPEYNFIEEYEKEIRNEDVVFHGSVESYMESIKKDYNTKYSDLSEYMNNKEKIDELDKEMIEKIEVDNENLLKKSDCFRIHLKNINSGKIIKIISEITAEHIVIQDEKWEDMILTEDCVGKTVLENPGKSNSLLNILIDLYDLNNHIDKSVIELWEDGLRSVESANLNLQEIYHNYREYGGDKEKQTVQTWLNRSTLGPRDKEDIIRMGKVLSNDELCHEYDYIHKELEKIRASKRSLGRHLSKIITMVIKDENALGDDPMSIIIWEGVKEYLFEIVKIEPVPMTAKTSSI